MDLRITTPKWSLHKLQKETEKGKERETYEGRGLKAIRDNSPGAKRKDKKSPSPEEGRRTPRQDQKRDSSVDSEKRKDLDNTRTKQCYLARDLEGFLKNCRQDVRFWNNSKGDIGIIFGKEDEPKALQKKERLQNILQRRIAKDEHLVRQKYLVHHPVIRLLERNLKKIDVNEVFLNDKGLDNLKDFHATSKLPNNFLDDLGLLGLKQNISIKRKVANSSLHTTFYT